MTGSGLRTRLLEPNAVIGFGGLLMTASMFFRFVYGPWGVPISYFSILSWNLSWPPSPVLLVLWPVGFGLLEAAYGLPMLIHGWVRQWYHWRVLAVFLATVAALQLGLLWWEGGMANFLRREALLTWTSAVGALVAVFMVAVIPLPADLRSQAVRLVGAAWILVGLYPVSEWTPVETVLWAYGPGYWMLLAGTVLITVGSVRRCAQCRSPQKRKFTDVPPVTGLRNKRGGSPFRDVPPFLPK